MKEHFCPAEQSTIIYQGKCNWCGELENQEPVAWPCLIDSADFSANIITLVMQCEDYKVSAGTHWLSTAPPQRTWVGLTKEEVLEFTRASWGVGVTASEFIRAIETKLKDKNDVAQETN